MKLLSLIALPFAGSWGQCQSAARTPPSGPPIVPPATPLGRHLATARDAARLPAVAGVRVTAAGDMTVHAFGVRRADAADLVTDGDHFHLGSNTKAITATLVGALVDDGVLTWDRTLGATFPEMAERMAPAWRSVTLRQLLMHRAGVAPFTSPDEFETVPQAVRRGEPMAQRLAFTTWMLHQPMPGAAGAFEYSNAGYGLAAAMVERVTGRSWDTMLQERLLDRLGIAASEVRVGWPGLRGAAPWGHVDDGRAWTPHSPTDDRIVAIPAALAPAGDLAMTMSAYGRFLQLHVQGLAGTDGAVKAATIRALHEPDGEYALGWGVQGPSGRTMHFHEGSVGTFHVVALLDPRRGVAVATVTNAGGEDAADRIRTAALKSLP